MAHQKRPNSNRLTMTGPTNAGPFDRIIQSRSRYSTVEAAQAVSDLRQLFPPKVIEEADRVIHLAQGRRVTRICGDCYYQASVGIGEDNKCIDKEACNRRRRTEFEKEIKMPQLRATQLTPDTQVLAIERLYELLPEVGVENTNISTKAISKDINLTNSQTTRLVKRLEDNGILFRRIVYTGSMGKRSFWKLLLPKEKALELMKEPLVQPATNGNSLKARILGAIAEKGHYDRLEGILTDIRKPGENIDLHNMTHLLQSLVKEGKVTIKQSTGRKMGSGQGDIPYDITIRTQGLAKPFAPESSNTAHEQHEDEMPMAASPVIETPRKPDPEPTPEIDLPHIKAFVKRREVLEQASETVDTYEPDIAAMLLEAAQKPLTPIEQEMVQLWYAHQECLSK